MKQFHALFNKLSCALGRCRECRVLDTDEGIGGKCIHCGRIHGWMTRDELRAFGSRT